MEKHLDFTIDFETCSLLGTAAPMQVAVVPWLRDNVTDPFCHEDEIEPYVGYVDLRTCAVNGLDFDTSTIRWWSTRSEAAKDAVCAGLPEPIDDVLANTLDYIIRLKEKYQLDSICLWSQGPDLDIAVLRNLCSRFDINLEKTIPHASFRDCRTVILEAALVHCRLLCDTGTPKAIMADPSKAYALYPPLPQRYACGGEAHNALYDAVNSSWRTWMALKWLKG